MTYLNLCVHTAPLSYRALNRPLSGEELLVELLPLKGGPSLSSAQPQPQPCLHCQAATSSSSSNHHHTAPSQGGKAFLDTLVREPHHKPPRKAP
jgi:hypothetical protein